MRWGVLWLIVAAISGCSSSQFDVAAGVDSSTEDSTSGDVTDTGANTADTTTDDANVADVVDASDAVVDTGSCEPKNACGGCGTLSGTVGAHCGDCGKLKCSADATKLNCVDPGKNACGGCAVLGAKPGDPCPSCGGAMKCNGPDALTCESTAPKNACGGCSTLTTLPGMTCGKCDSGTTKCSGTDAVVCDDPEAGKPAVGSTCGACSGGKYACSGGAIKCNDPVSDFGKSCGLCGASTLVCDTSTTTKCAKPDDRKIGSDLLAAPATPPVFKIAPGFGGTYTASSRTNSLLSSVGFFLRRRTKLATCAAAPPCGEGCIDDCSAGPCACKIDSAYFADGSLDLEVHRDTPTGAIVASGSVSTSTVSAMGGWVRWPASSLPAIAPGSAYFIGLRSTAKPGVIIEAADATGGLAVGTMTAATGVIAVDIQVNACGF